MTRILFLSSGRRETQFIRHLPAIGFEPVVLGGWNVDLAYSSVEGAREVGVPLVVDVAEPAQLRRVPASASTLVVRTPGAQQLVPGSTVVPDGFDPEDFSGDPPARDDGAFRIVVDGSPARLLEALDRLDRERRKAVELERARDADFRVADLLFLSAEKPWSIPSRTYEYVAAVRPILAAVPDGDARDLLEHAGTAHVCGPTDVKGLAGAIEAELERWSAGASVAHAHPAELAPYEWSRVTALLGGVCERVLGREGSERPIVARLAASQRS